MGFWSTLGKIGSIAGPIAAIPFTGGTSALGLTGLGAKSAATIGGILGAAGKIAGAVAPSAAALARGRAEGRAVDAAANQRQDALNLQRYGNVLNAANTDLARRRFALTAPDARASNAVHGDLLANARDFSYGAPRMVGNIPVPTSSGGRRPSILSDNTRALGRLMSQQALTGQQAGDAFAPLESAPTLTNLPGPNVGDKILTTAGTIGSLYDSFDEALKKYRRPTTPPFVEPNDMAGYG